MEIKTLSQELQKQEVLIQKLKQKSTVVYREGGAEQELELIQQLFQATGEVAGLREKLEKAEEGKWDAEREIKAAQVVRHRMAELEEETHVSEHLCILNVKICRHSYPAYSY